ncbi:NAD(P)-dependent oxidoreductase [Hymenobacter busanensis]|uniref:NAD(P)-dependent oxidoreductase n=1 Tax=Hymenobacter busanensis TaxID=2607656 RepID=A0A7L4ZUX7_9BACT|nr:NAD(P)-dependent oxidoreductase [Hymenobacter busanensis]KAA9339628.1 NAD(P)-dependent oxidoreductase [Hymenobacter busanensis]QHJ06616.1 NAD-binding protein [Hymenobacter busanensis]
MEQQPRLRIGFVGTGHMGAAMATHLLNAGHQMCVYNRTSGKTEALHHLGAEEASSPAEAARDAHVVFTMLTDAPALEEITFGPDGILSTLPAHAVHVSCSTVGPGTNEDLARAHSERGAQLVAAPVFGKPDAAAAGKLWVCMSGPAEAKQRVRPLLETYSQGIHDFGEAVGAANVVKLCGNFMLGAAIEAMAEAFTLAEKSGLNRQQVYEMFTSTMFDTPIYKSYGRMVATEDYKPLGAGPQLLEKDLNLVLDQARTHGVPMPFANIILDHLSATVLRRRHDEDWTSFARRVSEGAGIER